MARTATVLASPGLTAPKLSFYDAAGVSQDSFVIAPFGAMTAKYSGTIVAPAGTYAVELDDGGTVIQAWEGVKVTGVDPEVVIVRDAVNDLAGIKINQQYTRTNQAGDSLTETIVES